MRVWVCLCLFVLVCVCCCLLCVCICVFEMLFVCGLVGRLVLIDSGLIRYVLFRRVLVWFGPVWFGCFFVLHWFG